MKCIPIFSLILLAFPEAAHAGDKTPLPMRHALLVGCTKYPSLPVGKHLQGPANDVILVRDLLVKRFQFTDKNIVTLSEDAGETSDKLSPTRANIQREFARLAQVANKGDVVYIHLSGHGAQQPQKNPDDPDSYEPDGLSEIFLPADIGAWVDDKKGVANAIIDTEFRDWLKAIRAKGASLVVVVDTCHSGTMIRGTETVREVMMEELKIPVKAMNDARSLAEKLAAKYPDKLGPQSRGAEEGSLRLSNHVPDLVAIYAARPSEPTIEDRFPKGGADAKRYGLLTFTLVQVVTQSPRPLTYIEVVQKIHARYVAMGRNGPVPSVEGKDRDQEFLGQKSWPGRSRVVLKKTADGWKVNAGSLQGLTQGSILTVYPPADEATKVGHAQVTSLDALEAEVQPVAFAGMAKKTDLPDGGNCKVAYADFGLDRLKVYWDADKKVNPLHDAFTKIDKTAQSLVQIVDRPEQADWLLRSIKGGIGLVPAAGWTGKRSQNPHKFFGPLPIDDKLPETLNDTFQRIARARNLLRLSAAMEQDQSKEADQAFVPTVKVNLLRFPGGKGEAEKVPWGTQGVTLREGEVIAFELINEGKQAVDVSLLFVDNHYGISAVFPQPKTETDNRLKAGQTLRTPRGRVNAKSFGLEHVVVIAVRSQADRLTIDFSCLEQPSLELARGQTRGNPDQTFNNPLGKLLQTSLYGEGQIRGWTADEARNYATQVLSWTAVPKNKAP